MDTKKNGTRRRFPKNEWLPCIANGANRCYEPIVPESPPSDPINPPEPAPSRGRLFLRGLWAGCQSAQGLVLFASYIGYGGLCNGIGFPLGATLFSTFLIAALPSQLLVVGGYATGSPALAIAFAVLLSAARLLPSVVTLLPLLRGRGRLFPQLFASHFVAVSVWIESNRLLPPMPARDRLPFYFGFVALYNISTVSATLIGYLLASRLPHALAVGLLFLTPISFLLALTRNSRDSVDYMSLVFGLVLAPLFAQFGGRLDLLWTGLAGGTLAWLIHRLRRRAA